MEAELRAQVHHGVEHREGHAGRRGGRELADGGVAGRVVDPVADDDQEDAERGQGVEGSEESPGPEAEARPHGEVMSFQGSLISCT